jgi:hypothetical protein
VSDTEVRHQDAYGTAPLGEALHTVTTYGCPACESEFEVRTDANVAGTFGFGPKSTYPHEGCQGPG